MSERTISGGVAPAGDAPFDEFAALVGRIVDERAAALPAGHLAEVTGVAGGADARVRVRLWADDDGQDGQQLLARAAGTNLARGDTVVVLAVGENDYVVVVKLATKQADKAVVGADELIAGAVGPGHLGDRAVQARHLEGSAVTTPAVADASITPAKLSRAYATPADVGAAVGDATAGLASTTYVDNKVATRYQVPSGETVALRSWVTANFVDQGSSGGTTPASKVIVKGDSNQEQDVQDMFRNLANYMVCVNNNLGRTNRRPCSQWLNLFQ